MDEHENPYKLSHVGTFQKCSNCELTYFEGVTGKWPWRIFFQGRVQRFCTYRCMREFMRKHHIR